MTETVNTNGGFVWVIKILALCIVLTGCGWGRGPAQGVPCPGTGSALVSIGQWAQVAGCAVAGACALATVASFFPWTAFLQVFRPALQEGIAIGIATIILGTAAVWLGTHAWLMAIVVLLVVVGLGIRYRVRIRRFLGLQTKPTVKVKTDG